MRFLIFLTLAFSLSAADQGFTSLSAADAQRMVGEMTQYDTSAALFVWTDKYVYRPGEQLTLRGTLKPNGDLYPYTIVAYRINNQTGAKQYLPCGGATVCDIAGNTLDQGFRIARLPEFSKTVLVGAGGVVVSSTYTIPNELGMHTVVVQIRDYTGTRVVKSAYFKIGVVDGFEDINANITADKKLVNTKAYRLSGTVYVKNATLEIEPGTFIIGQPGSQPPSALLITNTSRILANGTRSRPIIMTSSQPFGQRKPGDWGGLVMVGKAPVNWPTGYGNIEGVPDSEDSRYGGTDPNHNCGTLRYVRVEYAGATLSPGNEINGITWGGCGKLTVTDHVQVTYGFDDAFEWFGGNNDGKYMVATYTQDDYIDWQIGWTGRLQHVVAVSNGGPSNRGIEADNNQTDFNFKPISKPQIYNVTFVGNPTSTEEDANSIAGIWLRRGTGAAINNVIVTNWTQTGMELRDTATVDRIDSTDLTVNGLLLWDNGKDRSKPNTLEGQVNSSNTPANVATPLLELLQGTRGRGANVLVANPLLRRAFEYSNPDFRPLLGSPVYRANWVQAPDDGFFDQWATYIGAFGDIDWTEEWVNFLTEEDVRP